MSLPASYFDVAGAAIGGGYRVIAIRAGQLQEQIIIQTAEDVAAATKLCGAAVLTRDLAVRQACRMRGVRLISTMEDER